MNTISEKDRLIELIDSAPMDDPLLDFMELRGLDNLQEATVDQLRAYARQWQLLGGV